MSLAERLIPASDVSEQISTAGFEASGTGNMKFMMNGALTIGSRDGATSRWRRRQARRTLFLFGLDAEQVEEARGWYDPRWHYAHEPETRAALDLLFADHFNPDEPGVFEPIRERVLDARDFFMVLADLAAYAAAQQDLAQGLREPARLDPPGDSERRGLGTLLERPNDPRIRDRHLARSPLAGRSQAATERAEVDRLRRILNGGMA